MARKTKKAVAFAQNQRDEVRDLKDAATALSAEAGTHQQTFVAEVQTYENHAQDSRVREIDVSDTRNRKDGTGGNNLPLVVYSKASHARNKDGDGERYEEGEVAQTRNTFDQGETRAQELVIGTFNQQASKGTGASSEANLCPTLSRPNTSTDVHAVAIVPAVAKTLSAEGFDGMPDIHKGNGMPVVAIEGNGSRPSHQGDGYSEEGVGYTLNHVEKHAVAIRTANTHANGHGVADEATHTLDCAQGQAVAVGINSPQPHSTTRGFGNEVQPTFGAAAGESGNNKPMVAVSIGFKGGQSANGGLGEEEEVAPTMAHQPSALEPTVAIGVSFDGRKDAPTLNEVSQTQTIGTNPGFKIGVAIGCDRRNQSGSPEVQPAIQSTVSDGGSTVAVGYGETGKGYWQDGTQCLRAEGENRPSRPGNVAVVGVDTYNLAQTGEVGRTLASAAADCDHMPCAMLKIRGGKDTYMKKDGRVGTAGKGPLVGEEQAFTISATQDQTLCLSHIVRRLTPGECESLQAFPQGWTAIPYRGKPAAECPDSPRYKALGNSWATNCAEWILERIVMLFDLGVIPYE